MERLKLAILAVVMTACIFLAACSSGTSEHVQISDSQDTSAPFELRMLDVGQGLCLVIKADGHYMIYDGGNRDSSSYVTSYALANNIGMFDYMIASHYDEDHLAGLIGVLHNSKVSKLICPDYKADSDIFRSFSKAVAAASPEVIHPSPGDFFSLGDAEIFILGPDDYAAEDENDRSIAIRVTYGAFSAVITGDAEREEEAEICRRFSAAKLNSDLYVVGHHGSAGSSSKAFLRKLSPDISFISSGQDNPYGHPSDQTLSRLSGSEIFRTDELGEVTLYSDGEKAWIGSSMKLSERILDQGFDGYIINENSMKFHLPDCKCVQDMADYNKNYSSQGRSELIQEGYEPCGFCKP